MIAYGLDSIFEGKASETYTGKHVLENWGNMNSPEALGPKHFKKKI